VRNQNGHTALFGLLDDDGIRAKQDLQTFGHLVRKGGVPSADEVEKQVMGWFEEAGAEWDVRDHSGRTLLHIVARHNTPRAVDRFKYLMNKRVDAMQEDEERRTALDVAAAYGNQGVLELFEREAEL